MNIFKWWLIKFKCYSKVACGGIIIIDDYYTWPGCARSVHDYLSNNKREERIRQYSNEIAYIEKLSNTEDNGL